MKLFQLGVLACAPALWGVTHLSAQQPVPPAPPGPVPCSTWFVDPVNGLDTNPGTLFLPFRTLTFAMGIAGGSAGPDTIVLLPGEYNDNVGNEIFPIMMLPDVSIQGTSALNAVLITRNAATPSVLRFDPFTPTAFDEVVVDGVTIVGRNRCIEVWDGAFAGFRVRSNPTIANSFLIDSVDSAVDIVVNPGVPFPGHDTDGNGFVENRPKLINCTIVASRIGVFNRIAGFGTSWGESEPGLLNCLLSDNPFSDLEGVDSLDVITSAFDTADAAGLSPIKAGTALPVAVFNTALMPPMYVEPTLGLALTPFDLRVIPGSPAIDVGSLPALVWANGTTGQRFFSCTVDIFDADCEGYGNLRVARTAIDIGADESGELIVGGYQRGTTDFNSGFNSPFPGQMVIWLNPFPPFPAGAYDGLFFVNTFPQVIGLGFWLPWDPPTIQDVRAIRTVPATTIPGIAGTLWMDPNPPGPITFTLNFTAPTVPVVLPVGAGASIVQFNMQVIPVQGTAAAPLTNLQTFFNTP